MKRGALRHFKTTRLATYLSAERPCDRAEALGIVEAIVNHVAPEVSPRGDIGRLSDDELAENIGTSRSPKLVVEALVKAGWLDRHPVYRLIIHDYHAHADNGVKLKLAHAGVSFVSAETQTTLGLSLGSGGAEPTLSIGLNGGVSHSSHGSGSRLLRSDGKGGAGGKGWKCVPVGELLTAGRRAAAVEIGLAPNRVKPEWDKYVDHTFKDPKSDVDKTWRNWVRRALEGAPGSKSATGVGDRTPSVAATRAAIARIRGGEAADA